MKRLFLSSGLVLSLAFFSGLSAQEGPFAVRPLADLPYPAASTLPPVVAISIDLVDSAGNVEQLIDYSAGQVWYVYITMVNLSSSAQPVKLEADFRFQDGGGYKIYRGTATMPAKSIASWRILCTPSVAALGVLTLTGRVHGAGMGNDNKVTSQAYVY